MVRERTDIWRPDGKSLGIILAILIQSASFIWYAAKLDSRVVNVVDHVDKIDTWKEKQDENTAKITAHLTGVEQKVEDQGVLLRRMDDKMDRILTHGK
jgi:hypothetical protein